MPCDLNKSIVRRQFEELINRKNLAVLDTDMAEDFVDHEASLTQPPGPEDVKRWITHLHEVIPDLKVTDEDIGAEGDKVVVRNTRGSTHTGPFMGFPHWKAVRAQGHGHVASSRGKVKGKVGDARPMGPKTAIAGRSLICSSMLRPDPAPLRAAGLRGRGRIPATVAGSVTPGGALEDLAPGRDIAFRGEQDDPAALIWHAQHQHVGGEPSDAARAEVHRGDDHTADEILGTVELRELRARCLRP
jgi:predicted ester cyclase